MGNPPFIGAMWSKGSQREDIAYVFPECSKPGEIDYVAGWYAKAIKYIQGTKIQCAFVSTNSISQGQQVALMWEPLMKQYGMKFNFAYRTFRWDSEANLKAHVHCVIIGFSLDESKQKFIFDGENKFEAKQINGYLDDAPNVFITATKKQVSNMPLMHMGSMARDGGFLMMDQDEYDQYIKEEPQGQMFIHQYMMGREFINNTRWRN